MNKNCAIICLLIIISCQTVSYSQKIITGIYSGVNFSDIHGQEIGGKWVSKPGPVQGFYLGYSLNKTLGIQTGINFTSIYYEHKSTSYPVEYYPYPFDDIVVPDYYTGVNKMDFSLLRVPLLLTVSIPSALEFHLKAGVFFSFMQNHSLNYNSYLFTSDPDNTKKKDFGYMFSSGISYPLANKIKAVFDVNYITGRNKFLENFNFRQGSSEFSLGIAYTGFIKEKTSGVSSDSRKDSLSKKVFVTVSGGFNYSWNQASTASEKYYGLMAPSLGFLLNFPLGKSASFQTGFSFVRKGYSIRDSSSSFYGVIKDNNQMYSVNTRVQIDYAVIPALLTFPLGKSQHLSFITGPWLGMKLNARTVGTAYNETHSGTSYTLNETIVYDDLEKTIKGYDLGWIFGCGISIPVVNKYSVDVALQYSTGFRDVFYNSGSADFQNPYDPVLAIRNRTISLLIGFRLP